MVSKAQHRTVYYCLISRHALASGSVKTSRTIDRLKEFTVRNNFTPHGWN